jgi:hypothetical protein
MAAKAPLSFRKGTAAFAKRRQIAEAIAREHPGVDMATKFKEATATVKKMSRHKTRKA